MFLPFLYELRRRGVPMGAHEAISLAGALKAGLHDSSLDGFYHVARALLVHSETHLDAFDQAFLAHFKGVEVAGQQLTEELLEWLKEARERRELTPEERALLEHFDVEELEKLFQQRLEEQRERHDGGTKWIGTGGASPFGHSGQPREGFRVGGPAGSGSKQAMRLAGARAYQGWAWTWAAMPDPKPASISRSPRGWATRIAVAAKGRTSRREPPVNAKAALVP